jgi:hypothetical protein
VRKSAIRASLAHLASGAVSKYDDGPGWSVLHVQTHTQTICVGLFLTTSTKFKVHDYPAQKAVAYFYIRYLNGSFLVLNLTAVSRLSTIFIVNVWWMEC